MIDENEDATDRAFTEKTVWEWQGRMREALPAKPLSDRDTPGLDVVSFNTSASGDAFLARVRTRDGSDVDLVMNPVAAIELMQTIRRAGRMAGWIDDDENISFPPLHDPRL